MTSASESERLSALTENIDLGISFISSDFRIVTANRTLQRMAGLKDSDLTGHFCYETLERTGEVCADCPGRRAMTAGESTELERRGERPDGSGFWLRIQAFPVMAEDGTPRGFVEVVEDITEHKLAEQERQRLQDQLLQAQKMESIGHLAGGVAHDFNNLLTPILGYTESLRDELADDDPRREELGYVLTAAEQARQLTQQLLTFSRRHLVSREPSDLDVLIQKFEELARRTLREDLAIELDLAGELPTMSCDPTLITQILMNLCLNSQDAMPDGGTITIRTRLETLGEDGVDSRPGLQPGAYVTLSVSDTGSGMSTEIQSHAFEPFFTTKDPTKGTGLGLATVYGVVRQHGGTVECVSAPGAGTTIRILLPIGETAVAPEPQSEVRPSRGAGETVVVVEDNELVRRLACEYLRRAGYDVMSAANGTACISLVEQLTDAPDLLLTDVIMPDMNGRELFNQLREMAPSLRVVFMSGYTGDVIARHCVHDDGVAFLQKPFVGATLITRVRDALDV